MINKIKEQLIKEINSSNSREDLVSTLAIYHNGLIRLYLSGKYKELNDSPNLK